MSIISVRLEENIHDSFTIGANSPIGIGRASAHQFAHNGAKAVYLCDYDDTYLATHKREIESLYPDVEVQIRQFDAGDASSVKAVVDDAISRYGRLDIMFANAGIVGSTKLFTEIESDEFMKTLRTNTLGCVSNQTHSGLIIYPFLT